MLKLRWFVKGIGFVTKEFSSIKSLNQYKLRNKKHIQEYRIFRDGTEVIMFNDHLVTKNQLLSAIKKFE